MRPTSQWTDRLPVPPRRRLAAAACLLSLLAACATGPEYSPPQAPKVAAFSTSPLADLGASGVRVQAGEAAPADWWTLFAAPRLDQTVRFALEGNHDLAGARASLAQAEAMAHAGTSGLFPEVDVNAGVGREKLGAASLGKIRFPAFSYYSAGVSVSYAFDFAGGVRRAVEAEGAQVDLQKFQLAAASLSLSGHVAQAALQVASARAQIDSLQSLMTEDRKTIDFVQQAFDAGAVSRVDLLSAQTQLAGDQTLMPPLEQALSAARHQLSVLAGHAPADWTPPDFNLDEWTALQRLPIGLPSELAHRRPDILAAEAQVHAANAGVGVATANLFPQITLSAGLGWQATDPGHLFNSSSVVDSLIAGLAGPVFDHGARQDRQRAARDALRAALEHYEQTVVASFGQVADVLEALDHDAELMQAQRRAAEAATASLELTRRSYQAGNAGVLQVLDAQRANEQAQLGLVRARVQGLSDQMLLLLATGGADPLTR